MTDTGLMTAAEAEAEGFVLDCHTYPWRAYKGPCFDPTEVVQVITPAWNGNSETKMPDEPHPLRSALQRALLTMNAVLSSPVCHPHNAIMLRDGIAKARTVLDGG